MKRGKKNVDVNSTQSFTLLLSEIIFRQLKIFLFHFLLISRSPHPPHVKQSRTKPFTWKGNEFNDAKFCIILSQIFSFWKNTTKNDFSLLEREKRMEMKMKIVKCGCGALFAFSFFFPHANTDTNTKSFFLHISVNWTCLNFESFPKKCVASTFVVFFSTLFFFLSFSVCHPCKWENNC